MAILRKSILALLPIMLSGCFTDFDPRIDAEPVLCINSLITAGQPIEVSVTHTWLYTDESGRDDHSVKDADVMIYANGKLTDNSFIPAEGDHIKISAYSPTYGEAEAEVMVPYAQEITRVDYIPNSVDVWMQQSEWDNQVYFNTDIGFGLDITVDIPYSDRTDYYYITYEKFLNDDSSSKVRFYEGSLSCTDPVFLEHVSAFEEMMDFMPDSSNIFFSNRLFGHDTYPFHIEFSSCRYSMSTTFPAGIGFDSDLLDCGYEVTLWTISRSYYDWLLYSWNVNSGMLGGFIDVGLAEPIWGYSNVSTGAGVVAARTPYTVTLNLKDFLRQTIEKNSSD